MNKSLIYFDEEDFQNSIDLLEVVNQIYKDSEYETYAVCFNDISEGKSYTSVGGGSTAKTNCKLQWGCKSPSNLRSRLLVVKRKQKLRSNFCDFNQDNGITHGQFDYLISIQDERIKNYDILNITNCIEELHHIHDFDSILIPATHFGRMLAPRLAARLEVGLVADVTGIDHEDGMVEMVRPAFNGKIFAAIVNTGCKPIIMSVRPNVFTYTSDYIKDTKKLNFQPNNVQPSGIKLLETREKEKVKDIRESEVLVSGGGGVIDDFEHLHLLADELNGMVSASRRIVDSGIAARSIQVGQSGKTVSPKLYFALGVYGSLQHIEGLKNVENIISVNINKDAPICSLSDIVVEGDAIEFIDKLVEKIKSNKPKLNIKEDEL